jgi:hypothetical protein
MNTKQVPGACPGMSIVSMSARQCMLALKAEAHICIGPTHEEFTLARIRAHPVYIGLLERARAEETEGDVVFDFLRISHWLGYSAHHVQHPGHRPRRQLHPGRADGGGRAYPARHA